MSQIPFDFFTRNIEAIQRIWNENYKSSYDMIGLINGKYNSTNQKNLCILSWLFSAYNFTETAFFMTKTEIWIIASQRKIQLLSNLKNFSQKYKVNFFKKQQNINIPLQKVFQSVIQNSKQAYKIGILDKESNQQGFIQYIKEYLISQTKLQLHESFDLFATCEYYKRKDQLKQIRCSAFLTNYFMKKYIDELQRILDRNIKLKHNQMVSIIQKKLNTQSQQTKCSIKAMKQLKQFDKRMIDVGHLEAQSGHQFSQKDLITSNEDFMEENCINLGLGMLYRTYNTFVSRTFVVNATSEQQSMYKKIITLHKTIVQNLRANKRLGDIYQKGVNFMKQNLPDVEPPQNFGFSTGTLLHNTNFEIKKNNKVLISEGNTFLILCNFPKIQYKLKDGSISYYGIKIADTIIISEKGQENLTQKIGIQYRDISYQLDTQSPQIIEQRKYIESLPNRPATRRGKQYEATINNLKIQKALNKHQKQLKKQKMQELKLRVHENFLQEKTQTKIECGKLRVFKTAQQVPKNISPKQIHILEHKNAVLLPINNKSVPFHIYLIKNVVRIEEGQVCSLRFNFHTNNTANLSFPKFNEPKVFIKQLVYRSKNKIKYQQIEKEIKALQKKAKIQLKQKKQNKDQVASLQSIKLNKGKRPILRDLYVRPNIGHKKGKRILECHLNGFRYKSQKGQNIDIIFSNIRFAFIQPCQHQIIVAVHFRLHDPILVNNKKTQDVQFYTDCGVMFEQIQSKNNNYDDYDDQQRVKQKRRKLDKDIHFWAKSCQQFKRDKFIFEFPDRNAGFYGCPYVRNILIQPTQNCLINIIENKFFIIPLQQIQVTCFERMYNNSRYFDFIIIMKDYEHFYKIGQISIRDADKIKRFIDSKNIIFYQQGRNLNWTKFLAGIRKDFKSFVDQNAWMAWDIIDEEIQGIDLENDQSFQMSDSDFQESSEESGSSSQYVSQDFDDKSQQQLSQQGLSSEQLQERAQIEDRQRDRRQIEKLRNKESKKRGVGSGNLRYPPPF